MKKNKMKANIEYIGKWPVDGKDAREKKRLIRITPEEHLHLIHGDKQHILVSLIVSSDYMHLGLISIPAGGYSEIEVHEGDEVLYVLKGTLVVRTFEPGEELDKEKTSHLSHTVRCGEKIFIPDGIKHCYKNFSEDEVNAYFAVAPKL